MTKKGVEALRRFLTWMRGFEESVEYREYKKYEHFTDAQWDSTVNTLLSLVQKEQSRP